MAKGEHKRSKTVAVVGGGVLLAWLFLSGKGWGLGGKRGHGAATEPRRVPIRVSDRGITADGVPATIDEAVAAARRTGAAEVFATGAARQGTFDDLIAGLRAAGVEIWRAAGSHA